MGGGLMQLVAYGAQDIYLTGNPQITFFKVVYRRHTNFAVEAIEQTFNGSAEFGKKFSCTISRNGDLLHRVYLEVDMIIDFWKEAAADELNASSGYGFDIINNVEVEIGGQCIDKHYGDWMAIWTSLTHGKDKANMLTELVGIKKVDGTGTGIKQSKQKLYIPLQFWFCRNPGLALPLIALQYHEVKLNVQFAAPPANLTYKDASAGTAGAAEVTNNVTVAPSCPNDVRQQIDSVCVFCDYIFLDTDERRRFAQVSHEYLIEQVQFSNALQLGSTNGGQVELRFNHPVKEILWHTSATAATGDKANVGDCLLQLNGHDRFRKRDGSYFRNVQRYEHHSGNTGAAGLHMYSFGLKPEEHQPSGTCNFSRIDNAVLSIEKSSATALSDSTLKVYAVNYNVLRIMSGMGGLAYSN